MQVIERCDLLSEVLSNALNRGKNVHFIPTMGALHDGHISLINHAKETNAIVIASVFVNPLQFNESNDLTNYPRTFELDRTALESAGCDIMFFPSNQEVYPSKAVPNYDLDGLDLIMEGHFRPGHFQGVVQVVDRLFSIVKPDKAFFGQKDFQQLAIIRHMMKKLGHLTNVIGCQTIREKSGLAMSSRNALLSRQAIETSRIIHDTLQQVKKDYVNNYDIEVIKESATYKINQAEGFEVEYLEIIEPERLTVIKENKNKAAVACAAAYVEGVRLIDNLTLIL